MCRISELYNLNHTMASSYLMGFRYPWEALPGIADMIRSLISELDREQYRELAPEVWVHNSAAVAPTAFLAGPTIVDSGTEIRHCAFIRGPALIGAGCVVGNSVELKNVILFDGVQVPHYNYVGDSILGYQAHMGAGSLTSNVKSDKSLVVIHSSRDYPTELKKVGAFLGDFAEIGCNCVLNPGTVVGKSSSIYPLSSVRGTVPENSIYKSGAVIVPKEE